MKKGVDYVGVGVGAVILNKEGKVFLALRGKEARNEIGKWECPGGGIRFGETMQETIIREMKEEFDINIKTLEQMDTIDGLLPNEKQHWVAVAYICKIIRGHPKILEPNKCEKIGWFTMEEMKKMSLAVSTKHRLMELKKRYKI